MTDPTPTLEPGVHDAGRAPFWEFTCDQTITVITAQWMGEAARIFAQELTNRSAGGEGSATVVFMSVDGMTGHYRVAMSGHPTRFTYLVVRRGDQKTPDEARKHTYERVNRNFPPVIAPTLPEPETDLRAQWLAVCDPSHPKDTMWVSPRIPDRLAASAAAKQVIVHRHPAGVLLTTNPAKLTYFTTEPSEDRLGDVLGYVIPKSRLNLDKAKVAAAVDLSNNVITEMLVEDIDLPRAEIVLKQHGSMIVRTVDETVARRKTLFHGVN